jgi:aspartyl-tRNA(Asn)/glutamyl-tRNA(Gln) amidotransferase subunit A
VAEESLAYLTETGFAGGLEIEAGVLSALGELLTDCDLLLMPTVVSRGFVAGDDYVDHGIVVGDVELPHYFQTLLTPLFNIASRCPVLNVPSGFADNGVPTGLQIVGRPYDDVTVFRAGAAYERLRPWLDGPDRRPLQAARESR